MLRRHSNALLTLSAALLLAAVIGVQLGHSAIAEIDPVHFRGAAPRPQGIDPNGLRPRVNAFAQAYGWDAGYAARTQDCGGNCDAREVRQAAAIAIEPIPVEAAVVPAWSDAAATAEPKPWPPGETGGQPLSVERYMHYPVEQASLEEPAEAKVPDEEGEPALEE